MKISLLKKQLHLRSGMLIKVYPAITLDTQKNTCWLTLTPGVRTIICLTCFALMLLYFCIFWHAFVCQVNVHSRLMSRNCTAKHIIRPDWGQPSFYVKCQTNVWKHCSTSVIFSLLLTIKLQHPTLFSLYNKQISMFDMPSAVISTCGCVLGNCTSQNLNPHEQFFFATCKWPAILQCHRTFACRFGVQPAKNACLRNWSDRHPLFFWQANVRTCFNFVSSAGTLQLFLTWTLLITIILIGFFWRHGETSMTSSTRPPDSHLHENPGPWQKHPHTDAASAV